MKARPPVPTGDPEAAERHVCARVPVAGPGETAGDLRRRLAGRSFDCASDVAVCEDGRLAGLVSMERLLAADEGAPLGSLMDADPPVVRPGTDQEVAAWKAVKHGESSLAVEDDAGRFAGLIPARRLLAVLLQEHHEDLARLSGVPADAISARTALQESPLRRLGHRLPWLVAGLAGSFVVADLVGRFEHDLGARLLLAFFLPGVVYLADAVGTQTETLIIRGLSVGVPIGNVVRREIGTGLLIGAALGILALPLLWLRWGDRPVALAVAVAVFVSCSSATLAAVAIPWVLHRLGRDPAYGSGPLATLLQDLLTVALYLLAAHWLIT